MNRQVSVQITKPNPKFGDSTDRVTLSKWWPGGRASFNIPNASQWEKISAIIETELGPILGWKTTRQLAANLKTRTKGARAKEKDLREALAGNPDLLKQIVSSIDTRKLSTADFETFLQTLGEISDAVTNANAGFRVAFLSVVRRLPKQKQRALEDLDLLLQGWSLHIITNVAQQVRARLETIELFKKQVQDNRTFEIIGANSIHRILERSMWVVDERYWLMFSNQTLRKSIGNEMSKLDKKRYGKKRPDFVCGTVGDRLIVLELKRPSHALSVDDLNQLETYVTVAEKYFSCRGYEAYLVGKNAEEELIRRMKHRSRSFRILYYANIIDDTCRRYKEFLESVQGEV